MFDTALYVVFPYVAVILAVIVGLYRYFTNRFSFSSLSTQFLEDRELFWGSVPWHYGISFILLAHLLAALFPAAWGAVLGSTARLYVMEVTGWGLALLTIAGVLIFILRRLSSPRLLAVTTWVDWLLLATLLTQVVLGLWVALFYRWGGLWYVHMVVPWLVSLFTLHPHPEYVSVLPLVVRLHILTGTFIIALFPFTRLVHVFTFPLTYLWRPYQVVIWYRRRTQGAS